MSAVDNGALIDAFSLYQRAADIADSTIKNRESILRSAASELNGPLVEATTAELRQVMGREGIKPSTRRTYRNAVRAFYRFLVEDGYRGDDPSDRLPRVVVPRDQPRPFATDEIERLLTTGAYKRTRAMILLGYYQGFRVSSISRTRGEDIDVRSGTITTVVKGGRTVSLPLHPVIAELAESMPPEGWWFPARNGADGPIRPGAVSDLIAKAKKRAGIVNPRLTAHSLRHAFGTELLDAGVDVRIVQELMTHASLSTTQLYTKVNDRQKRAGIGALPSGTVPVRSGRGAS